MILKQLENGFLSRLVAKPTNLRLNNSLELTWLSWSFAGFVGVATEVGERGLRAWAATQLSSNRWCVKRSLTLLLG